MFGHRQSFSTWILMCALATAATLSVIHWGFVGEWHDQQRVGLVLLICVCGLSAVMLLGRDQAPQFFGENVRYAIAGILVLGILSAWRARQPMWAFVEFAVQLGCVGVAWWIAVIRLRGGAGLDRALLWIVFSVCGLHILQFVAAYVAFCVTGLGGGDPFLLLAGFSNLRFYGQFITLTLPLLALPLVLSEVSRIRFILCFSMLSLWWGIAFISGTRGTWLGLSFSMLVLIFGGGIARRWVMWNLAGALVGLGVCWLCVSGIPDLMGVTTLNHPGNRSMTDLSCRELIWRMAMGMIYERPFLGFGPMHFADQVTRFECGMAAHPHQAWLQWASEWGVPSALTVSWLAVKGGIHAFRDVVAANGGRSNLNVLKICLLGSVLGALAQSMVDGVFVMPNTELWLAILSGWLLGASGNSECEIDKSAVNPLGVFWRWSLLAAGCLLMLVVVRDLPRLTDRVDDFAEVIGGPLMPRFWTQGIISYEK